jgi:hypothetical protein
MDPTNQKIAKPSLHLTLETAESLKKKESTIYLQLNV